MIIFLIGVDNGLDQGMAHDILTAEAREVDAQARFLRSADPSEGVEMGLSAEGHVEIRHIRDTYIVQLNRSHFFSHFTLEPLAIEGKALSDEVRVLRASLTRLIHEEVSHRDPRTDGASRGGWEMFREVLGFVPRLSNEVKLGPWTVRVDEVGASYNKQLLVLRGDIIMP